MSDPARDGAWFEDVDVETSFRLPPELEKRVLTPALVVDLDAVRRNVKAVVDVIGDVERYRPHLKTTKSRLVWRELLRAGINKFKVATTRELATLVETYHGEYPGAETTPPFRHLDVLVAYPAVGPSLARVGDIARRPENKARVRVSVLVECEDAVNELPDDVGCFVDVNPGMNRTGIALDSKDGVEFTAIPATIRAAWIRDSFHGKSPFRGVHYYEGHISECVDANGRSREDVDAAIESRDERCRASLETLAEARSPYTGPHTIAFAWCTPFLKDFSRRFSPPRTLACAWIAVARWLEHHRNETNSPARALPEMHSDHLEVVTSGTPGFVAASTFDLDAAVRRAWAAAVAKYTPSDAKPSSDAADTASPPPPPPQSWPSWPPPRHAHQLSPGTVVFHDWRGQRQNPRLGLAPAAAVMTRVVSVPAWGEVATLDCGSKSLACEAGNPAGYILGRPLWRAMACSEEHLPCDVGRALAAPRRGDVVFVIPEHACPTVNLGAFYTNVFHPSLGFNT
ncbi:uncharacterized protein MICPUCDRAFT_60812 [Micromonas pusilla CCMP1545]|uniref:Predicted protein n=1 Tax=Micromonas pusilla (strain CCMP1545) TaxID=564608 RepID=C1MZQ2_MICPC|nr:uncharacterized protein MICPUCDRAFT_60812 [Micromonas pusilla CCMP1545]EEH54642.1 predicted protein [Micromonas pusilla CCMP1545]|eukprot:XP_003060992.1 predicted protein [Micromonas pusilla CCMP1545]